jgi:isoleucyl-tRNA synthetase
MPFASIHYPFENKEVFDKNFPAEFIAEGLDQTRGWFYSLINLGVGLFDKAPYKNVIVNGIINAKDGQKMSKSQKNYTDPMEVVEKYGADALRYALLSTPLVRGESVSFGDEYVDEASKKVVQRFENAVDFYALYTNDNVIASSESQNVLDQWMLARVSETLQKVTGGFNSYKLDEAVRPLELLIDDLSTWYLRRSRDRLKSDDSAEALSAMKFIILETVKMSAPVMPFLAERVYLSIDGARESVHLEAWSKFKYENKEVLDEMKTVREIVTSALLVRQTNNIKVRQPLATLYTNKKVGEEYMDIIKEELNVLEVVIDEERVELTSLDLVITPELKLAGDKRELQREIRDLRKEAGLTQNDFADLEIVESKILLCDDELKASVRIKNVTVGEVTRIV